MEAWRTAVSRLARRIWFRLALFATAAVLLALAAGIVGSALPWDVTVNLGQNSVSNLLQIIATSMLAVTTFSLTAMIAAYSAAAQAGTPRASQLLIEDKTSQNALSSFLGSFVFAIVGIVALSTGYYTDQGKTILFFGTLVVIAIIVVTLLSWIHHLTTFGRMADIIDRVEHAANSTLTQHARHPHLRASPPVAIPDTATAVYSSRAGSLTGIDVGALHRLAADNDLTIHVVAIPGSPLDVGATLCMVEGAIADGTVDKLAAQFRVEPHRTYEQDPRLGCVALSEIASRALSPSTNDPGTAVEVLNAIQRVITTLLTTSAERDVEYVAVHVPSTTFEDIVTDAFRPIARDGASIVEVGLRLQHVLGALVSMATLSQAEVLRECSQSAERRACAALTDPGDIELIRSAASHARDGVS